MDFSIKLEGLEPAEEQQQAPVISAPVRSPSLNFDKPIAGLERDTVLPEIVAEDALRTNPQQFKQQKDLARKTGLPVDVVASDDGSLANSIRATPGSSLSVCTERRTQPLTGRLMLYGGLVKGLLVTLSAGLHDRRVLFLTPSPIS